MVEYDFDSYCLKPTIHFAVGILDEPEKICPTISDMPDINLFKDAFEEYRNIIKKTDVGKFHQRKHYRKNKEKILKDSKKYYKANPHVYRARSKVRTALKNGKLTKPDTCSNCNKETNIEAHHPDYNKPLEVIWLCRKCHKAEHRKN
jgi:hypothetical protein